MLEVPFLNEIIMEKTREDDARTLSRCSKPGSATFREIFSKQSSWSSAKNNWRASCDRLLPAPIWPNFARR